MSRATDILLVDDDPASIQVMGRILASVGRLRFATNGPDAMRLVRESTPDLVLLDAEMPGMSGFDVCRALKDDPELADVPLIFVTSHREADFEVTGFDLGAADFIVKPFSPPLVLARVHAQLRVKRMADELRRLSTLDPLTGIANRRRLERALEREWARHQRSKEPMALLMVDVDHFKRFNDRYGHPAGDTCLRLVAQTLRDVARRPADLVARYGGEEFAVLLPDTTVDGAHHVAQAALDAVQALRLPHADSPTATHVTISIGVASDGVPGATPTGGLTLRLNGDLSDLLHAADQALYAAKRAGRAQAWHFDLARLGRPDASELLCHPSHPLPAPGEPAAQASLLGDAAPEADAAPDASPGAARDATPPG